MWRKKWNLLQEGLNTSWEMEKILVSIIFSFSHNVLKGFFLQGYLKLGFCATELTLSSINTNLTQWRKKIEENIVEKGEIAQSEQFHLFPQCFLNYLYLNILS